ncbi:hypothetical protein OAC07_03870 [Candidatus Pelagibacter sp.]|nr:hypothetical protein [Candidatus Pelagibacter sp.]
MNKKILSIILVSLLWCNIGYSKEIVNLVCSFEKSIENKPMGDVVIGNKGDPDYSHYTNGRYIEYEVISKDEFYLISTSFIYKEVLPEKKQMQVDDKVISFVFKHAEDYTEIFMINRHTGILTQVIRRLMKKGHPQTTIYFSCNKKSKI